MRDALLIIDVGWRDGWTNQLADLPANRKDIALAIQQELAEWRRSNKVIVFIVLLPYLRKVDAQLEWGGTQTGCIGCDTSSEEHLAAFLEHRHDKQQFEPVFIKDQRDAFTNPELINFLRKRGITKVFLAGCQTFLCVLATARGAVGNGLEVVLVEECTYPALGREEDKIDWISRAKGESDKCGGSQNANVQVIKRMQLR